MELKERIYFENKSNYNPGGIKGLSLKYLHDINYLSAKIRSTAKDAMAELISPANAKREISDLLDNIKQLKKEKRG